AGRCVCWCWGRDAQQPRRWAGAAGGGLLVGWLLLALGGLRPSLGAVPAAAHVLGRGPVAGPVGQGAAAGHWAGAGVMAGVMVWRARQACPHSAHCSASALVGKPPS